MQTTVSTWDEAPTFIPDSGRSVLFSVIVSHNGRAAFDGELELASLRLELTDQYGNPLGETHANDLIQNLEVFQDTDRDGLFTPGTDLRVVVDSYLTLTEGVLDLEIPDGDADAGEHWPNIVRVTLPEDGVGAEDRTWDTVLSREPGSSLTTDPIVLGADASRLFADGFESGGTTEWSGTVGAS